MKHHVTYKEANALREIVKQASSGPGVSQKCVRLAAAGIDYVTGGRGPFCRECGERILPGEQAISFLFWPHMTEEILNGGLDPQDVPRRADVYTEGWLHAEACPVERQLR